MSIGHVSFSSIVEIKVRIPRAFVRLGKAPVVGILLWIVAQPNNHTFVLETVLLVQY